MRKLRYKPFRIVKDCSVRGPKDVLKEKFPEGKLRAVGAGQFEASYAYKAVVNMPSDEEINFFTKTGTVLAVEIPQDPRGMDKRDSGLARSVKSSVQAHRDCGYMIKRQEMELEQEREARKRDQAAKREARKAERAAVPRAAPKKMAESKTKEVESSRGARQRGRGSRMVKIDGPDGPERKSEANHD
jgi:hypothetical protein